MELKPTYIYDKSLELWLLIVPYGIETYSESILFSGLFAFNRTLWN